MYVFMKSVTTLNVAAPRNLISNLEGEKSFVVANLHLKELQ
jgi:hypothetical protein